MAKKAKKTLLTIIIILVVVLLLISLGIKMYGGHIVKAGIETAGSKVLQVDVRVKNVALWTLLGKLELKDLEIANPEGYSHEDFLSMGFAHIDLNTGSLFSDTVEIEKMQFDDVVLDLEQKGLSSNLHDILKNLPKTEKKPEEAPAEKEAGKNLVIKDLMINKVTVNVQLLPVPGKADTLSFTLEPIHMTNIGTEKKVNTAILMGKILTAIAAGVAEKGKDVLPTDMIGPLADTLKKQGLQMLESGQDVIKQGTELGEEVKGAVEGLFKKKEE